VMISLFVSFTLDPMLSSRILRKPRELWLFRLSERFFEMIDRGYEALLGVALRHRWTVIAVALASFAGAIYVGTFLRSEFIPKEDQSEFNVAVKAPLGASLATTRSIIDRIRAELKGKPWVAYAFTTIGADELKRVNEGTMYVKMLEKGERPISQMDAMAWMRERVAAIAPSLEGARVSVDVVPRISGGGFRSIEVQLEVRGNDLDLLESTAASIIGKMRKAGGYVDVDTTYEKGKPEIDIYVKRDRAADLGVHPLAVGHVVKALIGGDDVSKFKAGGDRYDVSVRLREKNRSRPEDIRLLTVRNDRGQLVPLENVARVAEESGPVQINRYGRSRQITVLANLVQGKKVLGEAMDELSRFVAEEKLPPGYTFGFTGEAEAKTESEENLRFALFLAIAIVYMVLASQFESFVHPFTIMLSLPLSVVGALGALVAFGMTMSIFSMIGIIMLMGLVTKNAILLIDYTNTLRRRDGVERNAAVLRAGPTRLRPILMTTFAMIFGMLPVALGRGAGSETRSPMAVAVIGGLIASTLLTLIVVPVVYTLLDDLVAKVRGVRDTVRPHTDVPTSAHGARSVLALEGEGALEKQCDRG
jgi:hydrophobic/amphiphilic exporter-1 (mainly G- bacteria), HAE1 family